jgi:trehalose 2-sulfotransferase
MQIPDRFVFEFHQRVTPRVFYMICSQPRSGSSFLCEMLANTLHAGMPAEYLRPDRVAMLKRRWAVETFDEYLHALTERKTSPNGVFGLKVHWGQYSEAAGDRNPTSLFDGLSSEMRFVNVRREDRVRQAVSWVRALQTGSWSTVLGPEQAQAVFDPEDIERKIGRLEKEEAAWERLFERYGISPFQLTYERLVEAPEDTTRAVLDFLGVELPAGFRFDPPLMQRQADELSEEWVARYLTSRSPSHGSRESRSP